MADEIKELREQNLLLRAELRRFLPHKRLFRQASFWLCFFLFSLFSTRILGVTVVTSFWALLGVFISTGFVLMSWVISKEWNKSRQENPCQ